jgi:hypothetical protein
MYIPHPSLFFGEPPTEMKRTLFICSARCRGGNEQFDDMALLVLGVE